jgi:hypothetical protein
LKKSQAGSHLGYFAFMAEAVPAFWQDAPLAKLLIRGYHLDMIPIPALVAACLQFVFLRQIGGDGSLLWN